MLVPIVRTPAAIVVGADDRTGALEVAGMCADLGLGPVAVVPRAVGGDGATSRASGSDAAALVEVHDLGTRHVHPQAAAEVSRAFEVGAAHGRSAHKIDSTLRGNWAVELLARVDAAVGRRVLVVPSLPALGRTCVGGVVLVDGVPVGETEAASDARAGVRSSRPADVLRAAGAGADDVVELRHAHELAGWSTRLAVCDAADDDDLRSIAAAWAAGPDDVVLAGTAAAIAAGAAAWAARVAPADHRPAALPRPTVAAPFLVVCGSLHPMARRQVAVLREAIADRGATIEVIASPEPSQRPVPHDAAEAEATRLSAAARQVQIDLRARTVLVVGGDTAAALLGDRPMSVGGTVATGMPWCTGGDLGADVVITKAGGFGAPDTLVEVLLGGTRR